MNTDSNSRCRLEYRATDKEQATFEAWAKEHLESGCGPAQDAAHTRWEMRVTFSGIGSVVVVRCVICGAENNITDYGSW